MPTSVVEIHVPNAQNVTITEDALTVALSDDRGDHLLLPSEMYRGNVIPAYAGIQFRGDGLDSRVRGNDHDAASAGY